MTGLRISQQPATSLSGGKAAGYAVPLPRSEILLLDEPTANLDINYQADFWNWRES